MTRTRSLLLAAIAAVSGVLCIDARAVSAHASSTSSSTAVARIYTVRSGDSLAGIAQRTGTTLSGLVLVNKLTVTSTIHPGQTLIVPPATTPANNRTPSSPVQTSSYTVMSGDYLAGISAKNGVTLRALLVANGLSSSSAIHPGQVLQLPLATKPKVLPPPSKAALTQPAAVAGPTDRLITFLRAQVGKPYRFFTAGPDTFDCSGLVVAGYKQLGITLIHQSRMQATMGIAVDFRTEPIVAGDLVFLRSSIDSTQIGHVGIALDSNTWIQAPGTGMSVRIRPMPNDDRIESVRRILTA